MGINASIPCFEMDNLPSTTEIWRSLFQGMGFEVLG